MAVEAESAPAVLPLPVKAVLIFLVVALGVNGVWMFVHPASWFQITPGVPYHGAFNAHLVRDLGTLFLILGGIYGYVLKHPDRGRLALRVGAWFFGIHAATHVGEVAFGHLTLAEAAEDLPLTLLLGGLAIWLLRHKWLGRPAA